MNSDSISGEEINNLVVKIGEKDISFEDVLERLIVMRGWQTISDCLDQFLIEPFFEKYGIALTEDEIRNQVTIFRQKNDLLSAEDISKWLEQHHMDDDDFLEMCECEAKLEKLKDVLFGEKLEAAFVYKRLELQTVGLYKIVVAQEDAAREIVSLINEGASFFDYARKYNIDEQTAKACGYMGKVKIKELPPQVQDLLSKGAAGDLLGPVKVNKNFEVYLLDSTHTPVFDGEIRRQLEDELFAQWLADTRLRAQIKYFV